MPRDAIKPVTLTRMLQKLTERHAAGAITLKLWQQAYEEALAQYHLAAYAHGAGVSLKQLTPEDLKLVARVVDRQEEFLAKYAQAWREGKYAEDNAAALARDAMYAEATKGTWWMGATRGYPLPAWPGDGTTQCKTRCNCTWDIVKLKGDGNADAYWRRGEGDHCQTCDERANDWSPLQIRDGEIVL